MPPNKRLAKSTMKTTINVILLISYRVTVCGSIFNEIKPSTSGEIKFTKSVTYEDEFVFLFFF